MIALGPVNMNALVKLPIQERALIIGQAYILMETLDCGACTALEILASIGREAHFQEMHGPHARGDVQELKDGIAQLIEPKSFKKDIEPEEDDSLDAYFAKMALELSR